MSHLVTTRLIHVAIYVICIYSLCSDIAALTCFAFFWTSSCDVIYTEGRLNLKFGCVILNFTHKYLLLPGSETEKLLKREIDDKGEGALVGSVHVYTGGIADLIIYGKLSITSTNAP